MKLNFTDGYYKTNTGQHVQVHTYLDELHLWYGRWIEKGRVVYINDVGQCNIDAVGSLEMRERGGGDKI